MNIFYLDSCPYQCAIWMTDKHVVKMIVETAQLLSTAHRVLDGDDKGKLPGEYDNYVYKLTHKNHPSAVWARESVENYNWLVDHLHGLLQEYTHRYKKKHKTELLFQYLQTPPFNLKNWDWTVPPSAMSEEYKISEDPIENYRNYYRLGKSHLHKWKDREKPFWLNS